MVRGVFAMRVYLDNCCFNRPFDYTEWRQNLYKDTPLDEFLKKANEHRAMAEFTLQKT